MFACILPLTLTGFSLAGGMLFDSPADPHSLQVIRVAGLTESVPGTVYPAGALEQGGMPLGGVGTGYVCVDTDGRLGKCSIFNRFPAPISLNQPFLSMEVAGKRLVIATPRDGAGDVGAVRYFGHFPVADVCYELDAPVSLELRAFSPFIPGDAMESNTPAAIFEAHVMNASQSDQSVCLAFSPGGFPSGDAEPFSIEKWSGVQVSHRPIEHLPAWVRHTFAILVEDGSVSTEGGVAGAIARRELKPGESATIRFILAWHQPYLRDSSGRVEKHIYATRFADAKSVAGHAAKSHADWLKRILAWQSVIYGADLPGWLKEALVNAPYALTKNSLWLARTRPDDWWGEEGLFLVNESFSTCSITETMPCRFFGHWPALLFFPELELTTLKAIRSFQLRGGEPPFCLGLAFGIRDPRYHCQHTCGAGEYAQMIYRYYLRTGDREFLKDFWDSARDSIAFMMSLDKDGDGLVEDHAHNIEGETFPANNPLDNWAWHGASSYTSGKGLATLVCGVKMAELADDKAQAEEWSGKLSQGQKSFEEKLWTGDYYRVYNETSSGRRNDACFAAQLSCVWCTRVLGLADPLPNDRMQKALESIARLNIPASPYGMVDAVYPDGTLCVEGGGSGIPDTCWSRDIFTQCNATAAMAFIYLGKREDGERAAKGMLDTIFRGPHAMPWSQPCGLNSKTGGTCHGHDYYDHMVVWSYPLSFAGQDISAACSPGGLIHDIIAAASPRK
ncbi:MAG TPA: GH116 family glycosyl hydrolase [Candidatus Brocadiia bacterium]|nr:GH116 family glycosyl hydrolase [Candidatus Brocadiia bacterium]